MGHWRRVSPSFAAAHCPGAGARDREWQSISGTWAIDGVMARHVIAHVPLMVCDAGRPRRAALARFSVRARHGGGEADLLDVSGRLIQLEGVP